MQNFKDVKIGQTFYTSNGQPSKKLTSTRAVSLVPEYCGFDFQDVVYDVEFNQHDNSHVYGIGKPLLN